jgi:hypothetical protein
MTACACGCATELARLTGAVGQLELVLREVRSLLRAPVVPAATPSRDEYDRVLAELPGLVARLVPAGGRVLVVSRGDDRLLALPDRHAGHFPQGPAGEYAGHHPHDSEEAVAEVERLHAAGWRYLVFPLTALWWLDHYEGLRVHLETTGRLLLRTEGVGVLYGLAARPTGPAGPDRPPALPTPRHAPEQP